MDPTSSDGSSERISIPNMLCLFQSLSGLRICSVANAWPLLVLDIWVPMGVIFLLLNGNINESDVSKNLQFHVSHLFLRWLNFRAQYLSFSSGIMVLAHCSNFNGDGQFASNCEVLGESVLARSEAVYLRSESHLGDSD